MSFLKFESLTGKYFLGIGVAVLIGVGAFIASDKSTVEDISDTGSRDIAAFLDPNRHLSNLTAADRTRLRIQYLERKCTNARGDDVSCGYANWPNGVPMENWNPQDPHMARIPRGTQVTVKIECDPRTRKFYTNVYFPQVCPNVVRTLPNGQLQISRGTECGEFYFENPYDADHRLSRSVPFSDQKQNWLTSPGVWNRDDMTNLTGRSSASADLNNLRATIASGGSNAVTEHHVVSDRKEWEGAKMTNTIWLKGDIAIHGSTYVPGYPASKGCIRLQNSRAHGFKAMGLYMLSKRVGTSNINYQFSGYGPPDPSIGGRPACSLNPDEIDSLRETGRVIAETPAEAETRSETSTRQSQNSFGALGRFFSNLFSGRAFQRNGNRQTAPQNTER